MATRKLLQNLAETKEAWPVVFFTGAICAVSVGAMAAHATKNPDIAFVNKSQVAPVHAKVVGLESHNSFFRWFRNSSPEIFGGLNERMSRPSASN